MRSPEKGQEPVTAADRVRARLDWLVLGLVIATHVMLVASLWGQWVRIGIITALLVGVSCLNLAISRRFTAERARNQLTLDSLEQRNQELAKALAELDLVHRRAREQERLSSLGMLAAGIAHEINNPMSYVKSNVHTLHQELREQKELPPVLREYVTEVLPQTLDGIKRVCSIVTDLRRFARGDPEALIEYDLNEEVQAALRMTPSQLVPQCDVVIELGPLLPMLGHPRQISQAVMNLLLNAAQAMKERGTVYVSTRPDGEDDVVLTVRDTGVGMAPEVQANLFQPFFPTRPEGEGTGLGLAVVHGIVTSHGGRIRVESQPGQGSTFTVRLPRVPPMKFIAEQHVPEQQPGASTIHVFKRPRVAPGTAED